MNTETMSMTQKGQVTIPRHIRESLGLRPHDRIEFALEGDHAVLRPATSRIAALYGSVEPRQRPEDFHALREEFEQGVADEVMAKMAREDGTSS